MVPTGFDERPGVDDLAQDFFRPPGVRKWGCPAVGDVLALGPRHRPRRLPAGSRVEVNKQVAEHAGVTQIPDVDPMMQSDAVVVREPSDDMGVVLNPGFPLAAVIHSRRIRLFLSRFADHRARTYRLRPAHDPESLNVDTL